jgi:hypothetical protein
MSTATNKWRRRSDPKASPGEAATTRTKRTEHPSPAYGSPAADMMGTGKRVRVKLGNGYWSIKYRSAEDLESHPPPAPDG